MPPTDRFAVVFPQRGKRARARVLRPLWGRTGGEAARWGQVFTGMALQAHAGTAEVMERVAERRTTSGVFE
ncbi:hypothetical protein ASD21_04050 [Caulobacter sp. Root1455]|nr:hypothetical protein ASD21_04050 [Caulobacter sp. Root1455]